MTTTTQPRRRPGIPEGGQFAHTQRDEAGIALQGHNVIPDLVELDAAALEVLQACRDAGGRPLLVGGAVRDALLARLTGEPVSGKDVDIEVHGVDAEALRAALPGEVNEQGKAFGVLYTRHRGQEFDVSLPRRDSKTGDGHRGFTVETGPDITLEEAFSRRDFTVNAMGWDPATGELVDPFGGRADLQDRVLRHTSEAFREDPLRVLRGVQLSARMGLRIAQETAAACREIRDAFGQLPKERVWAEFAKLAGRGTHISAAMDVLHETGWEEHFPSLAAVRDVPQDPAWHPEGPVHVHLGLAGDSAAAIADRDGLTGNDRQVVVLAAMLHDLGKATHTVTGPDGRITSHEHAEAGVEPARDFLSRIGAPGHVHERVLPLIREHMCHAATGSKPTKTAVRRLVRRLAGENGKGPTIEDWARVVDADVTGRGAGNKAPLGHLWVEVAAGLGQQEKPRPALLRGQHLMAAGLKPGPVFAELIRESLSAQDDGDFDDEAGAAAWLQRRLARA